MSNEFSPLITLSSPGSIALTFNFISIRWYGVLIAVAFLITYLLAEKLIKKYWREAEDNTNHFHNLIFLVLIFSIFFARMWFVFLNWDYFKIHPSEILKIWHGGQSIHGGILGAILATLVYSKIQNISFYKFIDLIAVIAPLGQSIGRWGNFFNNEAFGKPIESSFSSIISLYIPKEYRPSQFMQYDYFHPTFIYESFLDFTIFIFLYKMYPRWIRKEGKIFWTYLLLYSIVRFLIELIRVDSLYLFNLLPSAQIISIILILASLFMLVRLKTISR